MPSFRRVFGGVRNVFGFPKVDPLHQISATDSDSNGRLYRSQKGLLYRGISRQSEPLFRRLLDSGLIESLAQRGLLVETSVSKHRIEGYDLVFDHRSIPYVTYPSEWTPEMLRDSALQVLALQKALIEAGLQLHDGHCWNIVFAGARPVWVDLGSLEMASPNALWPAYTEFCRSFLHPITMSSAGHSEEARTMMRDYMHCVPTAMVEKLCPELTAKWSHSSCALLEVNERNRLALIDTLVQEISDVPLSRHSTDWSEYYSETPAEIEPSEGWRPKQRTFHKILQKVRPCTLVDIGSNRGIYGQIAARMGITVAAFDRDETAVTDLYKDVLDRNLPLTPLICDLMNPTPAMGINHRWFPSVYDRLRSEMAIALALVHHLVFKARLDFDQIASCFAGLTRRWLLVEFIPREDKYVKEWLEPVINF